MIRAFLYAYLILNGHVIILWVYNNERIIHIHIYWQFKEVTNERSNEIFIFLTADKQSLTTIPMGMKTTPSAPVSLSDIILNMQRKYKIRDLIHTFVKF